MSLTVKSVMLGSMQTNCYLVKDENTGKFFVADPGVYDEKLKSLLASNGVEKLEFILLTHGHFDHILGAKELSENYNGKIAIHKDDLEYLRDSSLSRVIPTPDKGELPGKADIVLDDGDILSFGEYEIKVLHTPGHTPGGACFAVADCIFSGDTLFKGSVGRMDFPGGNTLALLSSLRRLVELRGDYRIYPGHGEQTTLADEPRNNYYCRIGK